MNAQLSIQWIHYGHYDVSTRRKICTSPLCAMGYRVSLLIYRRIIAVQVGIIWMVMFVVGMFMNGEYVFSIGFQSCQSTGQGFDLTIDIKRVNIGQFKS